MFRSANDFVQRLWRDDSGVVLALTAIVFLTLFMMACAILAVGETVRERIEIQNAADAAAYSAAVTQADTISRIAAINRAMSWTYAQQVKMEMDAVVDKWLELVLQRFWPDRNIARGQAARSNCSNGPTTGWDDWYAGESYARREHVFLNKRQWVAALELEAGRAEAASRGSSYTQLAGRIQRTKDIISAMNMTVRDLITDLPNQVKRTVESVVRHNVSDTENDLLAGGGDFMYLLIHAENGMDLFDPVMNTEEHESLLLNYADLRTPPPEEFGKGSEDYEWFVREGGGEGIRRSYRQTGSQLIAEWRYWGRTWRFVKDVGCVPFESVSGSNEVRGEEGWSDFYVSSRARPYKLKPEFFGKKGAIVVGVSRRLNNPLRFMYPDDSQQGIFSPFTIDNRGRWMWAVAASRSAFNPNGTGDCGGGYDPTYFADENMNLKYSDWDAVLLPLHRAWADADKGTFTGATGGDILTEARGGAWMPITGGGGLGVQASPDIMKGGAEVNWTSAEKLIVH